MSSIKIKLSDAEIKKLQTNDNDNIIISVLKKAYPGLNLSFFDQAGKLSFNSLNLGNINQTVDLLKQKINQYLFSAKDKIVWGEISACGTCVGYAHENMSYIITQEAEGQYIVEQSVRQLDTDGHIIKEISVEAIKKFRAATKYEPTRYSSLAAAQEICAQDLMVLRDQRQLSWYHAEPPSTLIAQTNVGMYEIIEVAPESYHVAITQKGKTRVLPDLHTNVEKALGVCQQAFNEHQAKAASSRERV